MNSDLQLIRQARKITFISSLRFCTACELLADKRSSKLIRSQLDQQLRLISALAKLENDFFSHNDAS